ncbi:MAG: GHKL domain-containing protein [Leptospira sp.]|nr:GHKL domain-containing protein [Leptospira sp.]
MENDLSNSQNEKVDLQSLNQIFNGITEPLIYIEENFKIKNVNRAAVEFSKKSTKEELINQFCYEAIYGRDEICPYCPALISREDNSLNGLFPKNAENKRPTLSREILYKSKNHTKNLYLDYFPIEENGRIISIVEKISDITSIKEKEEESLRMRNLASIGILVSGIAHELNNPLTGINLTLQNLQNSLQKSSLEFIEKRLEMIRNDVNRAAHIVSEIISFAKPEKLKLSNGDIGETIKKAKDNVVRLYPVLSKNIDFILNFDSNYFLPFNSFKMERVFQNLFRNSLQAFDYRTGYIRVDMRKTKNMIHIIIEDNAGGIPKNIIDKIFDPFFTSNKQSNGTGLGLSVIYAIIREHQGTIIVKTMDDKTRFTISLPYPTSLGGVNE